MANEIGVAYLSLVPTFDGLQGHLDRAMRGVNTRRAGQDAGDGYSTGFGGAAKKITAALTGAFAAVQIKDFAKDVVSQASDMNEVATKMQVVFGDANGAVQQFASQGAKALGLSSLEAQNAAANFGVFGKAAGLAGQDQADFSTGMAKLAVDMASFSNTTPEDAIAALSAGLRGESEPLRQYGVLLDDATLRNTALQLGIVSTTKDALTPQQKVLAAHAEILKQTGDAQGDFARTSGGLANQQRILSAQWTDAKGKLGQVFLPEVTSVVSALNDKLFPVLGTIGEKASGAWKTFSDAWDSYGAPVIHTLLTGDFGGGGAGLEEDSPVIGIVLKLRDFGLETFDKLRGVWDTLWDTGEKLWPSIQSIARSLGGVFEKLSNAGLLGFVSSWNLLLQAFQGVADVLQAVLVPVFEWLAKFMEENPDAVMAFVGVIGAVATAMKLWAVAQWLVNVATTAWAAIMGASPIGLITIAVAALAAGLVWAYEKVDWFHNAIQFVWDIIQNAWTWISDNAHLVPDAFSAIWDAAQPVVEFLQRGFEAIKEIIQGVIDFVVGVFTGDWERAWNGIKEVFSGVWDWITNILGTALDVLSGMAGKLIEWGGQLMGWIWDGIKTGAVAVWQWFLDLPANLYAFIKDGWTQVVEWGHNLLIWILNGVITGSVDVWNWFLNLPTNLWNFVVTAWQAVTHYGYDMLVWIKQGVTDGSVALWNWFLNLPTDLWNFIVSAWQTVISWGSNVINWIWHGTDGSGGMVGAIPNIWNWFLGLPNFLWSKVGAAWEGFVDWGKGVVARIVEGINSVKGTVKTTILALFDFTLSDNDQNVQRLKDLANGGSIIPGLGGGARGAVVPGMDPGRRDNMLFKVRSGEAIMVPEWTQAVGGESAVHAMNRAAEQGTLGSMIGPGFARGGVVDAISSSQGLFDFGAKAGAVWGDAIVGKVKDARDALTASVSGGINNSQDPTSFGWRQAAGIVPYSWNGNPIVGGVAGGTEGLWKSLLDALVPSIPGGLIGPMWGYENRANVNSPGNASFHAFGLATDVNAEANPNGAPGYGRSGRGVIPAALAHSLAARLGMIWGGDFTGTPDPMHFEIHVAPGQISGGEVNLAAAANIPAGSGVERWRPTVDQALGILGLAKGFDNYVLHQMDTESSGNEQAINNWDSNAAKGTPSKGLMQVIDPTFRSYALAPYNKNIYDPLSNIIASIRYVLDRYGSIPAGMRGVAYDNGGWLQPNGSGVNFLNKPEAVLTPAESSAYISHAQALEAGFNGSTPLVINLDSSDPLQVAVGQMIEIGFHNGMAEFSSRLSTAGMQG